MLGFVLGTVGYPFCITMTASIFSKVVGGTQHQVHRTQRDRTLAGSFTTPPSMQAFWLGIFATFGQSARVIGPMLVTDLYQIFGTYALFGDVAATLVSATLLKQELSKKTIWQTSQCGC